MLGLVMPVVNCVSYTRAAIESARYAGGILLIVIDNASTDDTPKYLAQLDAPKIILRQETNLGVAASWNLGIRRAIAERCAPVVVANNDVVFAPDTLHRLERWWAVDKKPFVTVTAVSPPPDVHAEFKTLARVRHLSPDLDFCTFLIDAVVFESVGAFDERFWPAYYEDKDYERRMAARGVRAVRAHDALVVHHGSRSIREGGVENNPHFQRNRDLFRKLYGKSAAR
jgi:GT2 family glycosyltransferase